MSETEYTGGSTYGGESLFVVLYRFGRVNFILALRLELLKEVERLQHSLDVSGDVSYTCETAGHFFLYQVEGDIACVLQRLEFSF